VAQYRVEVAGHVGSRFADTFDVVLVEMRHGRTILTLDLQDQAALHGFLEMLESGGIELVAVNRADALDAPGRPSPG
jgi:hypothetical protein